MWTSFLFSKTERKTETISVWVVKCFNPSMPFNCCRQISIAVPPIKPVIVECDRKSTKIPSLQMTNNHQWRHLFHICKIRIIGNWLFPLLLSRLYLPKYTQSCLNQTRNKRGREDQANIQWEIIYRRNFSFYWWSYNYWTGCNSSNCNMLWTPKYRINQRWNKARICNTFGNSITPPKPVKPSNPDVTNISTTTRELAKELSAYTIQ